MFRGTLPVLGLLTILLTSIFFISSGTASAANLSIPQGNIPIIDFTQMQKTCAVINISLNGRQHNITCLHSRLPKRSSGVLPALGRSICAPLVTSMQIYNYAYGGVLCFEGDGYLGVRIYQVNEVDDLSNSTVWVRWYHEGSTNGYFCTIYPGYNGYGYWGNPADITLTQIDLGSIRSSSDPTCPPF